MNCSSSGVSSHYSLKHDCGGDFSVIRLISLFSMVYIVFVTCLVSTSLMFSHNQYNSVLKTLTLRLSSM